MGCGGARKVATAPNRLTGREGECGRGRRIAEVVDWRGSELYTKRERAALAWAEAVTNIQEGHAPDVVYEAVREQFTDVETVNLTLVITTINAWNRISIALGTHSGHAHEVNC